MEELPQPRSKVPPPLPSADNMGRPSVRCGGGFDAAVLELGLRRHDEGELSECRRLH